MVADHLKEKFELQTGELYRSLGEFVVNFEHLMFAAKNKINLLCGLGKENVLLLEPYSARQTIDLLNNLVQDRIELGRADSEDTQLFRQLVSDLRSLNTERNRCVHTMWFIGWHSDKDTDFSEARGMTWSALRKFKQQTVNAETFKDLTARCKDLYKVFYNAWPIDPKPLAGPPLRDFFSRSNSGRWTRRVT